MGEFPRAKFNAADRSQTSGSFVDPVAQPRQRAQPSPQCLHDWGRLQGTVGDSRGLDWRNKATSCQVVRTKVMRHQQVSFLPPIGFESRWGRHISERGSSQGRAAGAGARTGPPPWLLTYWRPAAEGGPQRVERGFCPIGRPRRASDPPSSPRARSLQRSHCAFVFSGSGGRTAPRESHRARRPS